VPIPKRFQHSIAYVFHTCPKGAVRNQEIDLDSLVEENVVAPKRTDTVKLACPVHDPVLTVGVNEQEAVEPPISKAALSAGWKFVGVATHEGCALGQREDGEGGRSKVESIIVAHR
jgi:hypothetical protein